MGDLLLVAIRVNPIIVWNHIGILFEPYGNIFALHTVSLQDVMVIRQSGIRWPPVLSLNLMATRSSKKIRRSHWESGLLVTSLLCVIASFALLWLGYSFFTSEFPDPGILRTQFPVVKYFGPKQPFDIVVNKVKPATWVSIGSIAPEAVAAIIVSEDWAFFSHPGYDARQIKFALQEDLQAGHFARGASTITQQMIKNVFLDQDKKLWRKIKEFILAVQAEKKLGKRRILEIYLNIAEWGEGIFGIGAASQFYFHKNPSQLTAREGAFLAMLLPSPKKYSQSFRNKQLTSYARETMNSILDKMVKAQYLNETESHIAKSSTLSFETSNERFDELGKDPSE